MSMAGTLRLALRRRAPLRKRDADARTHGCRAIRQPLTQASDAAGDKRIAWADIQQRRTAKKTSAQLAFGADLRAFSYAFALSALTGL